MIRQESISIVIPAFNEEANLEQCIRSCLAAASRLFARVEVIPVNDGSSDGTAAVAEKLAKEDNRIRPVHHAVNRGYGAALRSGFDNAREDMIFLTDGDNQFNPDELALLAERMDEAGMIIGYRIKRSDHFSRTLNAGIYNLIIRILFGLKVRDIDCAFKLFRRSILQTVSLKSDGALISAELLIKADRAGFSLLERGVHHYPRTAGKQTGADIRVILKAMIEIFRFYRELKCSSPASGIR